MRHLGYLEKIVRILENLYYGTPSAVKVNGNITEWFEAVIGVLQVAYFKNPNPLLTCIYSLRLSLPEHYFLIHSFIPVSFMESTIIPLVKCNKKFEQSSRDARKPIAFPVQ